VLRRNASVVLNRDELPAEYAYGFSVLLIGVVPFFQQHFVNCLIIDPGRIVAQEGRTILGVASHHFSMDSLHSGEHILLAVESCKNCGGGEKINHSSMLMVLLRNCNRGQPSRKKENIFAGEGKFLFCARNLRGACSTHRWLARRIFASGAILTRTQRVAFPLGETKREHATVNEGSHARAGGTPG
jgi:hypothetical protein